MPLKKSSSVAARPLIRTTRVLQHIILATVSGISRYGNARVTLEREAVSFLRPGTLPEAFALRALGRVRNDEELIRQALERFEAMGLDGPAAETRALLSGGA